MSAVTLMDAGTEPTVTAFLDALADVWGEGQSGGM